MKTIRYCLSIFAPADVFETLVRFESTDPFLAPRTGDFINPSLWPGLGDRADLKDKLLKAVHVEHGIEELDDHILQVVDIFTKAVENTEDVRRAGFLD